ncbi:hypothetical protein [Mycobacterium sp. SA01]|uniref:hypothetical protein n=1 Tax=Mycobacterium sp. SA01 TaxID=3238820 RepID=UPI00351B208D
MTAVAWVAIAAIVVSSFFNVLTLRRSSKTLTVAEGVAIRTEQRYQADLAQARADRIRDALIDVSSAVGAWNLANAWYAKLLRDFVRGDAKAGVVQAQDIEKLRPATAELMRAIEVASFVCDNERVVSLLEEIKVPVLKSAALLAAHSLSPAGVAKVCSQFATERKEAAAKATELLKVGHQLLSPGSDVVPTSDDEGGETPAEGE